VTDTWMEPCCNCGRDVETWFHGQGITCGGGCAKNHEHTVQLRGTIMELQNKLAVKNRKLDALGMV